MTDHPILGKHLHKALVQAGIADGLTRRVVIDIPVDGFPIIYRESLGDARVLDIVPTLAQGGVEIRGVPAEPTIRRAEHSMHEDYEQDILDETPKTTLPPEIEGDGTV